MNGSTPVRGRRPMLVGLGGWLLVVVASCEPVPDPPSRPNVVLILADDLGQGDLGCYGAERVRTPHLDHLAAGGVALDDAHSPSSVCSPTRYAVLTGRRAWRTRLKNWIVQEWQPLLIEDGTMTLAGLLAEAGYRTGCVGKWHLGFGRDAAPDWSGVLEPGPCDVGFEWYFGVPYSHNSSPELRVFVENRRVVGLADGERLEDPAVLERVQRKLPDTMQELTRKAVEFVETRDSRPFFLYFPTTAVHNPHTPSAGFRGQSQAGRYGDVVEELDACVGEILAALERAGVADRTLVVFTSDNGAYESWGEGGHRPNGPWRGGKAGLYEGGHRVPFVARWPGRIPAGERREGLVELTDLLATVATAAGIDVPATAAEDSVDVLPMLQDGAVDSPRESAVHHSITGMFALREGRWKLIDGLGDGAPRMTAEDWERARRSVKGSPNHDADGVLAEWRYEFPAPPAAAAGEPPGQLYDLTADPGETRNLWAEEPEVVSRLRARLEEIRGASDP